MKKFLAIAVVAVLIAWSLHRYSETQKTEREHEARTSRETSLLNTALKDMRDRHDASDQWIDQLRRGPIFSVDVERAWINSRPILFIGQLVDVATHDRESYAITVSSTWFTLLRELLPGNLRLELTCSKQLVDPVIDNLAANHGAVFPGVAVVAKINKIKRNESPLADGGSETIFSGYGECAELMYVNDVMLVK